ncbi:hypothetical protein CALVIDRAFT_599853 [Calocera viscosa TUFC12733]|uniref:F-box domain-containing protein n=1 Tax=Calocera viscosa (strain TUFC12733) TaxID=1330018 RepID=A0A167KBF8_CALVF|nr:hypothetical protein CALVIDRAFT_599853 [Calocera viscosa TUFC12733]
MSLSVELWSMIFELVQASASADVGWNKRQACLPVLLVCKDWKEIAEPLLFRTITISHNKAIRQLTTSLPLRHVARGPAASCIRQLRLTSMAYWGPDYRGPDYRDLMSLLSQTRNLISLTGLEGSFRELTVLAASCAGTLHNLDFTLAKDECISTALCVLKEFTSLSQLSFYTPVYRNYSVGQDAADIPLLEAPELRCLDLGARMEGAPSTTVTYFSRCRFPSLTELRLHDLQADELSTLYDFLSYHGPRLERIQFGRVNASIIPKPLFPRVRHFVFDNMDDMDEEPFPPGRWFPYFPTSVRHIHLLVVDIDAPELYLPFIDEVQKDRAAIHFDFIHLDDPEFSWSRLYEDSPDQAGHWVHFALRLKRETGITVLDKDGLMWTMAKPN